MLPLRQTTAWFRTQRATVATDRRVRWSPHQQPSIPIEDIWSDAPNHAGSVSHFFDFTPLETLTGIVTEQGILPVAAVEAWLAATKLHPALANYANGEMREQLMVP